MYFYSAFCFHICQYIFQDLVLILSVWVWTFLNTVCTNTTWIFVYYLAHQLNEIMAYPDLPPALIFPLEHNSRYAIKCPGNKTRKYVYTNALIIMMKSWHVFQWMWLCSFFLVHFEGNGFNPHLAHFLGCFPKVGNPRQSKDWSLIIHTLCTLLGTIWWLCIQSEHYDTNLRYEVCTGCLCLKIVLFD